jgi:Tfp pilus assembly PilM family ATPase
MRLKHAGLDISDDSIHCLEYAAGRIKKYACLDLEPGLIDGGDVKDDKKLTDILTDFDHLHHLSYVKVSLPEEKVYLFETDVPDQGTRAMVQNIEFKLEENVPLSAADAVFYFDLMPVPPVSGSCKASVTVVPRVYIEHYIDLLNRAGIWPIAFEVAPKSIANAIVPPHDTRTLLLVHIMNKKTGIYIVCGGTVCFTSTISWGSTMADVAKPDVARTQIAPLITEISRVYSFWSSHNNGNRLIDELVLLGRHAEHFEHVLENVVSGAVVPVAIAEVWRNALNLDHYIPPIKRDASLEYAVAAGLALSS